MRRLALLLTTVLVATLLAGLGAGPGDAAKPRKPKRGPTAVSLRVTPDRVTVYGGGMVEPTGLLAQVSPAKPGRVVVFQQRVASGWRTLAKARTDATGRAFRPLGALTVRGTFTYRATVTGTKFRKAGTSAPRVLSANSNDSAVDGRGCRPDSPPIGAANGEVYCLLQRLDSWRRSGLMGVGQQLNVSNAGFMAPLAGIRPNVVGFDLQELALTETYTHKPIPTLLNLARGGAVLTASWHATNPFDPAKTYSSAPEDITVLLPPVGSATKSPEDQEVFDRFWADWDAKLDLLARFQDGNGDSRLRTAVVVRPLHEPNGGFFWWGQRDPVAYKALWNALRQRAADRGVTNIVWAYSGNRKTTSTLDPARYLPPADLGGLDAYDPEQGRANAADTQPLEGYSTLAAKARRMALTEVGPHGSTDGSWDPAVITTAVRRQRLSPLWAMLWFDDTGYANAGKKQLTSLRGGRAWLASCFNSLCPTG